MRSLEPNTKNPQYSYNPYQPQFTRFLLPSKQNKREFNKSDNGE